MSGYLLHSYLSYLLLACTSGEPLRGHNISPANFHEFPFVASLGRKPPDILASRVHFCTGTLIAKKHVLTSAHCIEDEEKAEVDVIVGEVDLRTASIKYDVDSWISYVDWALERNKTIVFETNDLAIVKLSTTVYRLGIEPVKFTNLNARQLEKTRAVIAGWGTTNEGRLADVLQKARVTVVSLEQCERNVKLISNIPATLPRNYVCTSADPYTLAACGDSGGPVLDENNILLGVTRSMCPTRTWSDNPPEFVNQYKVNVHVAIGYYADFIEDVAKINSRCPFH